MSRSPAIAAAAIALVERIDPDEALRRVVSAGPHDVSPGLWADIKKLAAKVDQHFAKNTANNSANPKVTAKKTAKTISRNRTKKSGR
jgi:hypothetical protein